MKPNSSEDELVQALSLRMVAMLLVVHMFYVRMGCDKEREEIETILRDYHEHFGGRTRAQSYSGSASRGQACYSFIACGLPGWQGNDRYSRGSGVHIIRRSSVQDEKFVFCQCEPRRLVQSVWRRWS